LRHERFKKKRLETLHDRENALNKEMGKIDKEIKRLSIRKIKLQRMISKNMTYRNILIRNNG